MIHRILLAVLLIGAGLTGPSADAATISTLFASNNGGGGSGGAVYFDISVAGNSLDITGFTTNTASVSAFTWTVYLTTAGTSAFGNELNVGAWTAVATGSGTGLGNDLASVVVLDNPFTVAANSTYGMALVFGSAAHRYTNGTASNADYSNSDIALSLGSASNTPFTGPLRDPRVWNGSITYNLTSSVPEPTSLLLIGSGLLGLMIVRRRKV